MPGDLEVRGLGLRYRDGAWEERVARDVIIVNGAVLTFLVLLLIGTAWLGLWTFDYLFLSFAGLLFAVLGIAIGRLQGKQVEKRCRTGAVGPRAGDFGGWVYLIVIMGALWIGPWLATLWIGPWLVNGSWIAPTLFAAFAGYLIGVPAGVNLFERSRRETLWFRERTKAGVWRRATGSYFALPR